MKLQQPPLGIIEGFFGKTWNWAERAAYAGFLRDLGFDFYIYAPKDDRFLRQLWREPWPQPTLEQIAQLGETYRRKGLRMGLGLSPFELHRGDPAQEFAALKSKVLQLNEAKPDILCILFDDMRGDTPELAAKQARIIDSICNSSTATHFITCPTYYSTDPILERVFGDMPANYLEKFGALLDPAIDIFWTGPQVCSRRYPAEHLSWVTEALGRKPFLWDNYPVNDSAAMAPFLHIDAFHDRPAQLLGLIAGQAVNPMNQAWLSRLPLKTLADSYRLGEQYRPDCAFSQACSIVGDEALATLLRNDLELVQRTGLEKLSPAQIRSLTTRYAKHGGNPYADEVSRWLAGAYEFDPTCLT